MAKAKKPYARAPKRQTKKGPTRKVKANRQVTRQATKPRTAQRREVYKLLESTYSTNDLEDLLSKSLITAEGSAFFAGMPIQDILYSVTPTMKSMAYKYGFSIGKNLHKMAAGKNILPEVLEKAGFGKVVYYPFEDSVVITSAQSHIKETAMKENIHSLSSGIIAGYLTAATGKEIKTTETRCVYNGSENCQFVAKQPGEEVENFGSAHNIDAIAEAISNSTELPVSMREEYYMLTAMPLMKEPVLQEASKLLYLAGKKMGSHVNASDGKDTLVRMAKNFGVKQTRVTMGENGAATSISLEYGQNVSTRPFVELSTSLISGLANSLYNSKAEVGRKLGKSRNYIVNLRLSPN